jgi:hypothetical protein
MNRAGRRHEGNKSLKREYELVIDANGSDDEDADLSTVRSDRPRISRAQRRAAWRVLL